MPSDPETLLRLQRLLDAVNADASEIARGGADFLHTRRLMQESLDVLLNEMRPILAKVTPDRGKDVIEAWGAVGSAIGDLCLLATNMQVKLAEAGMPFS